jgi:hypothetical protein
MGVIALAEDAAILLRREIRIVIKMRSGELDFTCEENHGVSLIVRSISGLREE